MTIQYCEHNRKGLLMYSLYGRFRVFICALDKRHNRDWLAGWVEPCIAQCGTHIRRANGERAFKFPYKRIDRGDIPLSEEAIAQEEKEKAKRKAKAQEIRNEALSLIKKADKLEEV